MSGSYTLPQNDFTKFLFESQPDHMGFLQTKCKRIHDNSIFNVNAYAFKTGSLINMNQVFMIIEEELIKNNAQIIKIKCTDSDQEFLCCKTTLLDNVEYFQNASETFDTDQFITTVMLHNVPPDIITLIINFIHLDNVDFFDNIDHITLLKLISALDYLGNVTCKTAVLIFTIDKNERVFTSRTLDKPKNLMELALKYFVDNTQCIITQIVSENNMAGLISILGEYFNIFKNIKNPLSQQCMENGKQSLLNCKNLYDCEVMDINDVFAESQLLAIILSQYTDVATQYQQLIAFDNNETFRMRRDLIVKIIKNVTPANMVDTSSLDLLKCTHDIVIWNQKDIKKEFPKMCVVTNLIPQLKYLSYACHVRPHLNFYINRRLVVDVKMLCKNKCMLRRGEFVFIKRFDKPFQIYKIENIILDFDPNSEGAKQYQASRICKKAHKNMIELGEQFEIGNEWDKTWNDELCVTNNETYHREMYIVH